MSNYLVGDIQGCLDELLLLLEQVSFDSQKDTLWIAGDLVARGPKSLESLRFIRSLGDSVKVVLGNHDLHLIGVYLGLHRVNPKDKTQAIFDADDCSDIIDWLRQQPLLVEHPEFVMSHAGIYPLWTLQQARQAAQEVESVLSGDNWQSLIKEMYGNAPDIWSPYLQGMARLRFNINALTRMRYCYHDGRLDMASKLPPEQEDKSTLIPWFELKQRQTLPKQAIFGHWAALMGIESDDVIGLDTGCVWGNHMTMLRWEDKRYFIQAAL
ncbi:bis(5'-nucleosyl)-tetraphosphatase (symmetrical) [Vibrio sp. UCD-FRSSP16_10]|uniref:bis(5'-nucleosyl)-tetraphosphatase (symmetrical) ApaH n=1 Tax=unclassified Vibrio TaxID=2614977 RepID=UPI0007FFCBE2|nr:MULTISPECIES: bis(5'-nucleosyl)-tetraphosphatase (symmetrical) ApaH [unclassified Vibrio]OBT16768.1 bis(5'-nucleosyl)-tetraphosphatase (symmetrical) [Vibrio sp. UCD-FRSSP16_30]OBT21395.1 bis(5'-nucleosyl)-tetraphosphatase (symmetrical) [Vibrio sp. UCD-FRSSP16_10]